MFVERTILPDVYSLSPRKPGSSIMLSKTSKWVPERIHWDFSDRKDGTGYINPQNRD